MSTSPPSYEGTTKDDQPPNASSGLRIIQLCRYQLRIDKEGARKFCGGKLEQENEIIEIGLDTKYAELHQLIVGRIAVRWAHICRGKVYAWSLVLTTVDGQKIAIRDQFTWEGALKLFLAQNDARLEFRFCFASDEVKEWIFSIMNWKWRLTTRKV